MNRLQVAALVAVLSTGALAATARGLTPRRRSLAEVRAMLLVAGHDERSGGTGRARWLVAGMVASAVERRMGDDLRAAGSSTGEVAARVMLGALLGTGSVLLAVSASVAAGRLSPSPIWLLLAPLVGALLAGAAWHDARNRVETHRRAFHQATNDFVQLVAVGLTTDQSVDEAIRFALAVGGGPAMAQLRSGLLTAPQRGVALWEALDQLGRTHQRRELCELAASIERQGVHGVSITETVSTLASTMRAAALDDLEREADRANANLSGPTIAFVVTTVVFLAYPLAIRISAAFGA